MVDKSQHEYLDIMNAKRKIIKRPGDPRCRKFREKRNNCVIGTSNDSRPFLTSKVCPLISEGLYIGNKGNALESRTMINRDLVNKFWVKCETLQDSLEF